MTDAANLIPPAAELRANQKEAAGRELQEQLAHAAHAIKEAAGGGWRSAEVDTLRPEVIDVLLSKGYTVGREQTGPNETPWVIRW